MLVWAGADVGDTTSFELVGRRGYRQQIAARSTPAARKSSDFKREPATSCHCSSGYSKIVVSTPALSATIRASISTSKNQREWKGCANKSLIAGVTRNSFAPHWVSY